MWLPVASMIVPQRNEGWKYVHPFCFLIISRVDCENSLWRTIDTSSRNHVTYIYPMTGLTESSITTHMSQWTNPFIGAFEIMVCNRLLRVPREILIKMLFRARLLALETYFTRDPIVIFSETIDQDDSASSDHWEVSTYVSYPISSRLWREITESSIHKLANRAIQAASAKFTYRLGCRVP